jgi:intraflagellar transport protein 81
VQVELAPLLNELKNSRKRYLEVETEYTQKKQAYEKIAVGLELEKQQLESECDAFQDECLREESR